MNQKLIALDLDGTTLNNEAKLSKTTIATLKKAIQAGHVVSIVTGRPNRLSQAYYDQLGLTSPMINFNGSLGHMPHQHWQYEYQYTFDRGIVLDLLQHQQEFNIQMIAAEGKHLFLAHQNETTQVGFFPAVLSHDQQLNAVTLKKNPTSMTIAVDRPLQKQLQSYIEDRFGNFVDVAPWGGPNSVLEIGAKGVQKAVGVERLANYYHIDRQNVIAFGDEHNDMEMIDYAGQGVAMNNATNQLKAIADDVTELNNDQDGMAKYLSKALKLA
ncbi:HAD family phosphatase [Lactobacillus sp. LC28-10]|uniref:HAD family phosphatase n=1 Tax=Secundilactobacillus angelensis TaxID=2722706 RepID=A0ABX1L0A9_9LACO|nr:Cof-type HAD-IIB family hydrolase [Secundilactobacillus angelensis]MCH5461451.1 Cof-type HAD-IIB family hydrolase [Secundilactobacillus angelensis]NLR17736.1 HAD family phosphatase [Secundilactobacillus angelensis]